MLASQTLQQPSFDTLMLIQCTSCGTQAKIPDSKEGAKVKCPSCAHVYTARPAGRGGSGRPRKEDPTKYFLIGGIALGAVVIAIMASGGGDELPQASEKPVEKPKATAEWVDPMSWEGPMVTLARSLHQAAGTGNDVRLGSKFSQQLAYDYQLPDAFRSSPIYQKEAEEAAIAEAEARAARPTWSALTDVDRINFAADTVKTAMTAGADGAVSGWKPFDGKVEAVEDGYAIVRLNVQAKDTSLGLADRTTQWVLHNSAGEFGPDDAWKWVRVERWLSLEEAAELRAPRRKKSVKKTLSDGSLVYESEIRPIPFPGDVSPEEQARLTKIVDDYTSDIDARPKVRRALEQDLILAGKNAVPPILTKMAAIVPGMSTNAQESLEDRIRLNWLHETLREITGYETTFDVAVEMGATQERIDSGIKQWFSWYDRKFKRFDQREEDTADPFADDAALQPQTKEEKRQFERAKRQLEEEKRREKEASGG